MTATQPPPARRRVLYLVLAVTVLAPLVVVAMKIDDWSRDLTTNRAHTAPGQRHEPLEFAGVAVDRVEAAARSFAEHDRAWRLANEKPLPDDSPLPALLNGPPAATLHFVRTTGLMRFKDDVWLLLQKYDDGSTRLFAESRSRVGKGDLGQNPRNLAELKARVAAALGD